MTTNEAEPTTPAAADAGVADLAFDAAFAELKLAIEELEAGGLSLEETIRRTERAVALQRHCEKLLGEAELRVRQLVARPGGGLETRDLRSEDAPADA
ncbi:MAG TPA: exodeoxyribonuclease VII small subunit [Candidatus Limnocylindrales bacterium]